jgi:hypothetical protein
MDAAVVLALVSLPVICSSVRVAVSNWRSVALLVRRRPSDPPSHFGGGGGAQVGESTTLLAHLPSGETQSQVCAIHIRACLHECQRLRTAFGRPPAVKQVTWVC